ncbi:MAG: nucleoside hydrolase [Atopobiaceae bacterium]|jgi:purine nucleosidase|nr:nucleoside hydrolase [Atopobiaceae bacterium]MCI1497912.1 nucleoside hydrolase [Atopobiaceae bacterium]MCI1539677.1 nucleoside hydrolase [Atopobiaceae bacterium]
MKKIILDLDTGIDDALAIAHVLGSPDAELLGITGTYGNVLLSQGLRNSLALTELLGHAEVPVFAGLPHALAEEGFSVSEASAFIHGGNGIGNISVADSARAVQDMSAVDFIIDSAHRYGDELVYVPTGPQTNLAAALRKDPSLKDTLNVVLMGGALTVPGNINAWTEANIGQDPEAANEVFRSGIHATMIGLDVTLQTLLTKKETGQWRETGTKAGRAYADMVDYYIGAYAKNAPYLGGCGLHDPLAAAAAIDPSLVGCLPINMKVDCEGPTRGRTIGDETRLNVPEKSMRVAVTVDVPRFLADLMRNIGNVLAEAREA